MPYTRPYAGGFIDFPNTTTPLTASVMNTMDVGIQTATATADTALANANRIFTNEAARDAAITLPVEGMQVYLTAPTVPLATASDYVGTPTGVQTIYNGAVWVCVTPVGALTFASGTTASATFTETLAGSPGTNPAVRLVTGTSALVHLKASMANSGANQTNVSFAISGATTRGAFVDFGIQTNQIAAINAGGTIMVTGLTAGTNTFTMQYSAPPSGTGTFARRSIVVQGVS